MKARLGVHDEVKKGVWTGAHPGGIIPKTPRRGWGVRRSLGASRVSGGLNAKQPKRKSAPRDCWTWEAERSCPLPPPPPHPVPTYSVLKCYHTERNGIRNLGWTLRNHDDNEEVNKTLQGNYSDFSYLMNLSRMPKNQGNEFLNSR